MFDFHMHSAFSGDCKVEMEEMVKSSIAKGLKEIAFTDHIDYDYPGDDIVFDFDQQRYTQRINSLRQQYEGRLTIRKGVEVGLQPHLYERYDQLIKQHAFDFVIASLHTVDRKGLHYGDLFVEYSIVEGCQLYYEELLDAVTNFKNYSILGHVDLIQRYLPERINLTFHDLLEKIFKQVVADGKGIEVNTSGIRYGLPSVHPSDDILQLYKQCGGEIITLGSDAHRPEDIGFHFKESLELLQSNGFSYIATFQQGKPTFHAIDRL